MRTIALVLASWLFLACSGKTAPAPAPSNATEETATTEAPAEPEAMKPGTSGYPGLDWGATADELKARFPRAAPGTDNLSITGNHAGKPGVTTFELKDGKLHRISVTFEGDYGSMEECTKAWNEMRATLDGTLGRSAEENLAAYWDTATYNIVLACDPVEDENGEVRGEISMSYAQPED